ncbi:hypothetical protein LSTR_LSTR003795 [Laodelphax striatellus]|uniref:Uncharacterized protein n=1 Tax=Laodelphax striatellus TaxID=195883 RepID=A0A482WH86_LAOST|nr:hypothetical protein LSTR_LSTR017558 [Laodelphax striatellus]RZF44155.1 hypothetical protein LSTR_LSTR003795 [Laodelphax striatellus]
MMRAAAESWMHWSDTAANTRFSGSPSTRNEDRPRATPSTPTSKPVPCSQVAPWPPPVSLPTPTHSSGASQEYSPVCSIHRPTVGRKNASTVAAFTL